MLLEVSSSMPDAQWEIALFAEVADLLGMLSSRTLKSCFSSVGTSLLRRSRTVNRTSTR